MSSEILSFQCDQDFLLFLKRFKFKYYFETCTPRSIWVYTHPNASTPFSNFPGFMRFYDHFKGNGYLPNLDGRIFFSINSRCLSSHESVTPDELFEVDVLDESVTPDESVTNTNFCLCGCRQILSGRQKYFNSACRKRAQRDRERY